MIDFKILYETPMDVVTFYRYTHTVTCCYEIEYDDLTKNCGLKRSNHKGLNIYSKFRGWIGVVPVINPDESILSWEIAVNAVAFDII